MKSKVLVFPSGTEIANEIIASLAHNKTFETVLATSDKESYCSFSNKEIHDLPFVTEDSFIETLSSLILSEKIEFIIPAHDDVAYKLSEIEEHLSVKVIGQTYEVNKIVRYKDETYNYFKDLLPIGNIFENHEIVSEFPVFVKPKRGQGSLNAFRIKNHDELEAFKNKYCSNDFVIMECFTGEEYTIDCFSDNGKVLFSGARTREKTINGISVISKSVEEPLLKYKFNEYAEVISNSLNMQGLWFFQMKRDNQNRLKLLEIAPRVSGTMMLNRAKGVNFVEMALYQAHGFDVEVLINNAEVSVGRALTPTYKHNYTYDSLYVDFDDTLFIDDNYINTDLMKLIFQCKNENKKVILITKNKKNNLASTLHKFGMSNIFNEIIHLNYDNKKFNFMKPNSILIDDSFSERKEVISENMYALGVDAINVLFNG